MPAAVAVAVAVTVAAVLVVLSWRRRRRRTREPYVQAVVGGALAVASIAVPFVDKLFRKKKKKYEPTYSGRLNDGIDWVCPDNAVETGAVEDAKACLTSEFAPPVWKAGPDGVWAHLCPNGTVPTPESEWERKCAVGWTARVQSAGAWVCPGDTQDSGKTWDNTPSWHEAQKQCRRTKPYTQRVQVDNNWVCPPGTKDTGKSWNDGADVGRKQCKWTGP